MSTEQGPRPPHPSQARGGAPDGAALDRARDAVRAQIESLGREFDAIVAASQASNADDEHDPEGATIAFERQQVAALLEQARRRLADIDAAVTAVEAGTYGRCESCGGPIAPERLAARPAARTCIDCAT
ncbi:RNA polymerase-binding protein DksA [Geodermatophilus poikilotrophus]|uniref:RNA polymerase-binding protein DksA n=1 Tax=Geodermatophilus poikilotrophus TaxID=1333667 RepID=A0A1I0D076_9ACTN|nr:RNA polymerase-binding protein DksA [Geodermatophilus poikilotrophus]